MIFVVSASMFIFEQLKFTTSTQFNRTKTIIETLKNDSIPKDIVFFGSSVCMSAIDGKILEYSSNKSVINLGSFDQQLYESTCYYQYVDENVKKVYQLISIKDLANPDSLIPINTERRLIYYNHKIEPEIEKILEGTKKNLLTKSFFEQQLSLRTTVFQNLRTKLRCLLKGKDRTEEIIVNELKSPHYYNEDVSQERLTMLINIHGPQELINHFYISQLKLNIIKKSQQMFQKKGIEYYLIIEPINPAIENYNQNYKSELKEYINHNNELKIIDLSTFLTADDFIDHIHINKTGRDKITEYLKDKI